MRARTLSLLILGACTNVAEGLPATVRDRLEAAAVELLVSPAQSSGSITAQRRVPGGWVSGSVDLVVKSGELEVTADDRGAITIERLFVHLDTIELPRSLLGYDAQLTDVHLGNRRTTAVATTWTGEDAARARAEIDLELTWSITIDGEESQLGAPRLRPVPLELELTGDGTAIHADARATAPGTFWSWADLVKLEDLRLTLAADTMAAAPMIAAVAREARL